MKTNFTILVGAAMMMACSESASEVTSEANETPVPIRLSTGLSIESRADHDGSAGGSIATGDNLSNVGIAGWEVKSAGSPDYSSTPTWQTTIGFTANSAVQPVTWGGETQYYNPNGNKTYMVAWYPKGNLATSNITFLGNTNGKFDIIMCEPVNGSKSDAGTKTLAFSHKTVQFNIKVQAADKAAQNITVTKLQLSGIGIPTGINLKNFSLNYTGDQTANIIEKEFKLQDLCKEVGTPAVVGNPVMTFPDTSSAYKQTVTVKVTYYTGTDQATTQEKTASVELGADRAAGTAFDILLKFSGKEVQLNATLTEWVKKDVSVDID